MQENEMRWVERLQPDWPQQLEDLGRPPGGVWLQGALPDLERSVAVVGTRRASPAALDWTRSLCRRLACAGWTVCSGGARGIDSAAHEGAMDGGGCTLVVLATGLQRPYPASNAALFARARGSGALLAEEPPRGGVRPYHFLRRNALLAALARLVLVVQAPHRSGALSTADHARALGRPVLVVPASPWDPHGAGNIRLLRSGATAYQGPACLEASLEEGTGVRSASQESLDFVGATEPPDVQPGLEAWACAVREALLEAPQSTDALCARLDWSAVTLQKRVAVLTLRGQLSQLADGRLCWRLPY